MASETIVAVYDSAATAQQVVKELENTGVPSSAIETYSSDRYNVAERDALTGNGSGTAASSGQHHGGFWSWLFGEDDTSASHHAVYDQSLQRGGTVVTVIAHEADSQRVMDILERHNPIDIEEHGETGTGGFATTSAQSTGATGAVAGAGAYTGAERTRERVGREGDVLTLSEEQLVIGKREVERGTARLRKYVVSRPVEEQIQLREETVRMFRRPVTETDRVPGDAFTDRTIELREMGEEAVVGKTARVVEEVGLEKQVGERVETVRDTVRREEVEVQGVNDRGATAGRTGGLGANTGATGAGATGTTTTTKTTTEKYGSSGPSTGIGIGAGSPAPTGVGPGTETGVGTGGQSSGVTTGRTGTY